LWVVAAAEERVVVAETAGDWGVRVESRHAGQTKAGTFVVAPPDGVESVFPPRPKDQPPQARARLPETLRRLESGEKLKILAWGDSVTPHYVMPEWMGPGFVERGQRDIDDDPRPYVAGLKAFVAAHPERVALADAARRYGRLWRQGIPYLTLMENNINHPNVAGHRIFADALDEVFSGPAR